MKKIIFGQMLKLYNGWTQIWDVILWNLKFSISTSPFYTLSRISIEFLFPIFSLIGAYLAKNILNYLSTSDEISIDRKDIIMIFAGVAILALARIISSKVKTYCEIVHSELLEKRISTDMMDFSFRVDLSFFDNPIHQNKLMSATKDASILVHSLGTVLLLLSSILSFLLTFSILFRYHWFYAILITASAIPAAFSLKNYTKSIYHLSLSQILAQRKLSYIKGLASHRDMAQDLRLFQSAEILKKNYENTWRDLFLERRLMLKLKSTVTGFLEMFPELALVFLSLHVFYRIVLGELSIGDYVLYTGIMAQLWSTTSLFISSAIGIYENKLRMMNYKSLYSYQNQIQSEGKLKLETIEELTFEKVSFSYPLSKDFSLRNISFNLKAPERVAFVGINGSGKSTLIKLILRFYDPQEGKILLNGRDIKSYDLDSLRRGFTVYFQEMENFYFSIKDNFLLTDARTVDFKKMMQSLEFSELSKIIVSGEKWEERYITKFFSEQGWILSGGQYQKLALARVLYRKNLAFILDEISSNLDPEAEHKIFKNLNALTQGKLTIFTSHRLSNVSLAQRVIVLEHGQIIEDGSPEDLLKNNQRYAELLRYQQAKYNSVKISSIHE